MLKNATASNIVLSDSEQAFIACLIVEPAAVLPVADNLQSSDFDLPQNRAIFRLAKALQKRGIPVDTVTLIDHAEDEALRAAIGTASQGVYSASNAGAYATHLIKRSRSRQALEVCNETTDALKKSGADVGEVVRGASRRLLALDNFLTDTEITLDRAVQSAVEELGVKARSEELNGVPTGLINLDETLGGLHDGDLIVIGARAAMGKTALLLTMADNAQVPLGIVSAEQPANQLALRLIAGRGRIPLQRLRHPAKLREADWTSIADAARELTNRGIVIDDRAAPTIGQIVSRLRKWRIELGIKIAFVDYLQKIRGSDPRAPRHEQVAECVASLKDIARELNIPIVALAQAGRGCEERTNKRPRLADLQWASQIEQEADQVLMIYRDDVYNPRTVGKGIAEIIIEKNRHGPTGTVKVMFHGQWVRFEDEMSRATG